MSDIETQTPSAPQRQSDRALLLEIRRVLADPTLSDSECIERICRIYEKLPDMPAAELRVRRD